MFVSFHRVVNNGMKGAVDLQLMVGFRIISYVISSCNLTFPHSLWSLTKCVIRIRFKWPPRPEIEACKRSTLRLRLPPQFALD